MTPSLHSKLSALADRCEALATEIRATLSAPDAPSPSPFKRARNATDAEIEATIERLKQASREEAEAALGDLPHATLSQIHKALGGGSRDAKKPKDFVIGRILWQLFDFSQGHEILKQPTIESP